VETERVQQVLSTSWAAEALHTNDPTNASGIERQSMSALLQYLNRKRLVEKWEKTGWHRIR
jgi:hypothetical protein